MRKLLLLAALAAFAISFSSCNDDDSNAAEGTATAFYWADDCYLQSADNDWQSYSASGVFVNTVKKDNNVESIARDTVVSKARLKRSIVAEDGWTAEQEKEDIATSTNALVEILSTKDSTWNDGKYRWTAKKLVKRVKTFVTLADKSQKENVWLVQEWINVTVNYENTQATFKNFGAKAEHKADTQKDGNKIMYQDTLYYTLDTNLQKVVTKGELTVNSKSNSIFPPEWGKIIDASAHHALDFDKSQGVDTWVIYFENNYILPVVIRDREPQWDFSQVHRSEEDLRIFTGAAYDEVDGIWRPTTVIVDPKYIIYRHYAAIIVLVGKNYIEKLGEKWNPDNGNTYEPITKYTFAIENGVLKVYFDGNFMYEFTSGK